jgi:hypothetical protein
MQVSQTLKKDPLQCSDLAVSNPKGDLGLYKNSCGQSFANIDLRKLFV